MHAFALGGLEGHRQALEPAVEEESSGGEEFIGGLSEAGLLVKGESVIGIARSLFTRA